MVLQLLIGTGVIVLSVVIAAGFAAAALSLLDRLGPWLVRAPHGPKFLITLIGFVLWVQAAATVYVWIWALVYLALGLFPGLEPAVYFSIVSFTTLGFGDVILSKDWRLLSGMSAANGLLMFGFFTAFLVEMMRRVRREQVVGRPEAD